MATLTAAQEILLGAADLARSGKREFSEWDLTVAVWLRNKNRFGCRGYEASYPDHKRVMMEIMGKTKKDNPVCRGWIEKVRTNYYKITSLGLAEAERVNSVAVGAAPTVRSPEPIYDAVSGFLEHPVFQSHLKSAEEPRTWLGAAAFLGLSQYTPDTLERRMRTVREAVVKALDWLAQTGQGTLTRGPVGGGVQIQRRDLEKVRAFLDVLEERFAIQFKAIRSRQG